MVQEEICFVIDRGFIFGKYIPEITSRYITWPCFNIVIFHNLFTYYYFALDTTVMFTNLYIYVCIYTYIHTHYISLTFYTVYVITFYNVNSIYFFCGRELSHIFKFFFQHPHDALLSLQTFYFRPICHICLPYNISNSTIFCFLLFSA